MSQLVPTQPTIPGLADAREAAQHTLAWVFDREMLQIAATIRCLLPAAATVMINSVDRFGYPPGIRLVGVCDSEDRPLWTSHGPVSAELAAACDRANVSWSVMVCRFSDALESALTGRAPEAHWHELPAEEAGKFVVLRNARILHVVLLPSTDTVAAALAASATPDAVTRRRITRWNECARLLPVTGPGQHPVIQIAGVQVFGYIDSRGGTPVLRVAIDLERPDRGLCIGADPVVPLDIDVGSRTVYTAPLPDPSLPEAAGAVLRHGGHDE